MTGVKFDVRAIHYEHKGGTKDYDILFIKSPLSEVKEEGAYVIVRRWGKVGAVGQIKVETYDNKWRAEKMYDDYRAARTSKDYFSEDGEIRSVMTPAEITDSLPPSSVSKLEAFFNRAGSYKEVAEKVDENEYYEKKVKTVESKDTVEAWGTW